MAQYFVFTNYGTEGWKPSYIGSHFTAAVNDRETQLSYGNGEVLILKRVELLVTEKSDGADKP